MWSFYNGINFSTYIDVFGNHKHKSYLKKNIDILGKKKNCYLNILYNI